MKRLIFTLVILFTSTTGSAAIITDLVGDMDGFGIGATNGAAFDFLPLIGSGDGDGTDQWTSSDLVLSHNYDLTGLGAVVSATLEVFSGGQGHLGLSSVYIDNQFVGNLTDGETDQNIAWLNTFDLSSFLPILDGSNSVRIDVPQFDGWVLDYSRLVIETAESTSVPEPGTLALLGLGLAGIGVSRRSKKVK